MTEWGIFDDGGKIEGGFYLKQEAESVMYDRYNAEGDVTQGDVWVALVCPDHEEQEQECCEDCNGEAEECERCEGATTVAGHTCPDCGGTGYLGGG